MFRDPIRIFLAIACLAIGSPALANNAALFIHNSDYNILDDSSDAGRNDRVLRTLRSSDFLVISGQNRWGEEMQSMVQLFAGQLSDADRTLVILAGHFVHTPRDSWLLGTETDQADGVSVGATSLSVGAILDIVSAFPGGAVVMLAPSENPPADNAGLQPGIGPLDIPQGVTVFTGPLDNLQRLMARSLLQPGVTLAEVAAAASPSVEVAGYITDAIPFLPTESPAAPVVDEEGVFWQVVQTIGTAEAYEAYLNSYPRGVFRNNATRQIALILEGPQRDAEAVEKALGLDRDARKEIQRNLALLGFDPHGIDGIFGPGTRAAISQWQTQAGLDDTGFLSRIQIARLQSEADVRAAELEEEARLRQLAEERRDRKFWRGTGISGQEDDLRAYLERYPDGLFADTAREQLDVFEADRRATAAAEERDYWDEVRATDTTKSYREYLQRYPDGTFKSDAQLRLSDIQGVNAAQIAAARLEERQVAGNTITRLLVEQRLSALGLEPGPIDGRFDKETRRAIRRFQRARDLEPTGFVTQQTMVRLLTG